MFNMRIDIIRKELERRFREVEELEGKNEDETIESSKSFIHFLLTEPVIKPFILELAKFDEIFLNSNEYNQIVELSIEAIKNIITKIDGASFIDQEFKESFNKKFGDLRNFFELPNPDIENRYISLDQFLTILRNPNHNKEFILNDLNGVKETIYNIFNIAGERSSACNDELVRSSYEQLDNCIERGVAYIKYKAKYVGATSLYNLLFPYAPSHYGYLSGLDLKVFSTIIQPRRNIRKTFGPNATAITANEDFVKDCREVYFAVDKFLMTGKSKSALIERLRTYCMWIRRKNFPKPESKNKENEISKILEEFIFNHGYFPLVHFEMGRSIPDILYEPSNIVHWDNSVLLELKQYIREKDQEVEIRRKLPDDIGQAAGYYDLVKDTKRDVADTVHLLIFYNGKKRFYLGESYPVEKNVVVEFVYVGKETPSTLKSVSIDEK